MSYFEKLMNDQLIASTAASKTPSAMENLMNDQLIAATAASKTPSAMENLMNDQLIAATAASKLPKTPSAMEKLMNDQLIAANAASKLPKTPSAMEKLMNDQLIAANAANATDVIGSINTAVAAAATSITEASAAINAIVISEWNKYVFDATDKLISGIAFGTVDTNYKYIIGYYTSPVSRTSEYNYEKTSSVFDDIEVQAQLQSVKEEANITNSIKFNDGFYLSRFSKTVDKPSRTLTYTFVVSDLDGMEDTVVVQDTYTSWSELPEANTEMDMSIKCELENGQFVGYIKDTYMGPSLPDNYADHHEFKCHKYIIPKKPTPLVEPGQDVILPPAYSPGPIVAQASNNSALLIIGGLLFLMAIVFFGYMMTQQKKPAQPTNMPGGETGDMLNPNPLTNNL
jgi:hypothetical protein